MAATNPGSSNEDPELMTHCLKREQVTRHVELLDNSIDTGL
jgi:hypothetical protein